jgi:hypothetical protein
MDASATDKRGWFPPPPEGYEEPKREEPRSSGGLFLIDADHDWQESDLPRRPWLAANFLQRRTVTLLAGRGGVGKSSLALGWGCALCLGQSFGAFRPQLIENRALRVSIFGIEDDYDEMRRRLAACLRQFEAQPGDLKGRLALVCPTDGAGVLLRRDANSSVLLETPAMTRLEEHLAEFKPDALFCDPLGEMHCEDENDNIAMKEVLARLRTCARQHETALTALHHLRKSKANGDDLDTLADAIRGGGGIVNAARQAFVMRGMSAADAEELGVPVEGRHHFARLDAVKDNYAPPARKATWMELSSYELATGELVGAVVPWTPPTRHPPGLPTLMMLAEQIGHGIGGQPYSSKLSSDARSVRRLFEQHGIADKQQGKTLAALMRDCGIRERAYRRPNRAVAQGLATTDGLPAVDWVCTDVGP